jgi:hypothetical protein
LWVQNKKSRAKIVTLKKPFELMNFLLKNYQHTIETLQYVFLMINALLHLLFAGAVAKDCGYLAKKGLKPIMVSPTTWAFTALLGGVWAAGFYWLLHHSSLTRPFANHKNEQLI